MLDAVVDYLPSPLDIDHLEGTLMDGETVAVRQTDEADSLSSLAWQESPPPSTCASSRFVRSTPSCWRTARRS